MASSPPLIQDGTISQSTWSDTDHHANEFEYMTIDDVETGQPQYYHAILVHSVDDISVALNLEKELKSEDPSLKICIPDRDMLPGASTHSTTAALIAKRCKTCIVVLSKNFLRSPGCEFQLKFAHALSPAYNKKKIIPVITETLPQGFPPELYPVSPINLTRTDLYEWSWRRLCVAIRCPIPRLNPDTKLQEELSGV